MAARASAAGTSASAAPPPPALAAAPSARCSSCSAGNGWPSASAATAAADASALSCRLPAGSAETAAAMNHLVWGHATTNTALTDIRLAQIAHHVQNTLGELSDEDPHPATACCPWTRGAAAGPVPLVHPSVRQSLPAAQAAGRPPARRRPMPRRRAPTGARPGPRRHRQRLHHGHIFSTQGQACILLRRSWLCVSAHPTMPHSLCMLKAPGSSSDMMTCRSSGPAATPAAAAASADFAAAASSSRAKNSASCGSPISRAHTPTASLWAPAAGGNTAASVT